MATERENSEVPQWNTAELDCVETAPDLLDRTSFVGHLAQGLLRSRTGESLVTAIYGPWGSGKSWIKHRLIEELRTLSPELITVEFSPWQIRGVDELTLQFFSQVYEKIDPPAPPETVSAPSEGARLWAQLARLSGVVPAAVRIVGGAVGVATGDPGVTAAALAAAGAGENFAKVVGARAAEAKSEAAEADEELPLTVQETRRRLEAFFNPEAASRLLVIMDDFDRLTADEIQAMVRLIKANANFSGLNYLLFCDPEQLALALDEVASGKGREFLEKIVQNPIRLPAPDKEAIFTQLCNGLGDIARRVGAPFDPAEKRLHYYFNGFLSHKLKNLRSVYRLIDAVNFSSAALTRSNQLEVDLIDLCAVDHLRLSMPQLANWIHEQGAKYFGSSGGFTSSSHDNKVKFSTAIPEHLRETPGVATCYAVLRQLFASLGNVDLEREHVRPGNQLVCQKIYPLAIRDEEHFEAYFTFQLSSTRIAEGDFRLAWERFKSGDASKLDFKKWAERRWLLSSIRRMDLEAFTLTGDQKQELFLAFARHADSYGFNDSIQDIWGELIAAEHFLESLIQALPETKTGPLMERLFGEETSLYARMFFLENLWIRCAPKEWPNRQARSGTPLMAKRRVDELRAALAPIAEQAIARSRYLDHPMLGSRLYRWRNSVGSIYTGPAMRRFLRDGQLDLIWTIMRGVARSKVPEYRMSFEFGMSYAKPEAGAASGAFLQELQAFTERDFWSEFDQSQRSVYPTVELPENGDACLIHHVRRALKTGNSNEQSNSQG
jgi:hypothetical protein